MRIKGKCFLFLSNCTELFHQSKITEGNAVAQILQVKDDRQDQTALFLTFLDETCRLRLSTILLSS